jgi:hypothetical protein
MTAATQSRYCRRKLIGTSSMKRIKTTCARWRTGTGGHGRRGRDNRSGDNCATRNSAQILRLTDYGTIANGKNASFIGLDGNLLESITNTRRISREYLRGEELNRTKLSSELTGGNSR